MRRTFCKFHLPGSLANYYSYSKIIFQFIFFDIETVINFFTMGSTVNNLEDKKPYNSFHLAKLIIFNIFAGVFDNFLKVLGNRIWNNLLPVTSTVKRCIVVVSTWSRTAMLTLTAPPLLLSISMLNFSIQVNICHKLFIYLNPTSISIAPLLSPSHHIRTMDISRLLNLLIWGLGH